MLIALGVQSNLQALRSRYVPNPAIAKNNNYPFGALLANQYGEIMVMAKNTAKEVNPA
jgi:hypothetical protein